MEKISREDANNLLVCNYTVTPYRDYIVTLDDGTVIVDDTSVGGLTKDEKRAIIDCYTSVIQFQVLVS